MNVNIYLNLFISAFLSAIIKYITEGVPSETSEVNKLNISKKSIISFLLLLLFSFNIVLAQEAPELKGTYAIVYDPETNEILYTKDYNVKAYPASMTKLMTAILLAENTEKEDLLTYTKTAASQPAFSYGKNVEMVLVGDTMKADHAMDALLLYSGNDIAYMIADNVSGNTDNFVSEMNKKAAELGLTNTHFVTPNGLDDNTDKHLTTPYDMAKLTSYAYSIDWIKDSMGKEASTVRTKNSIPREIKNRNKNLGVNGCVGGKTGYTSKAGRCLTAIYEIEGRTLIGVVMNSEYVYGVDKAVFDDMNNLMEYAYNKKKADYKKSGEILKTITLQYKAIPFIGPKVTKNVDLILRDDITYYQTDIEPVLDVTNSNSIDIWKITPETQLGSATLTIEGYTKEYKLYSDIDRSILLKDNYLIYIGAAVGVLVFLVILVVLIKKVSGRKKSRYRY